MVALDGIYVSLMIAVMWALPPIVDKRILMTCDVEPMSFLIIKGGVHIITTAALILVYNNQLVKDFRKLNVQQLALIATTSIIAGLIANLYYLDVIQKHDSYVMTAIMYSSPLFVFLFALVYLHERVTVYSIAGILLIVIGVMSLAYHEHIKG